jgi:hypothetical protein
MNTLDASFLLFWSQENTDNEDRSLPSQVQSLRGCLRGSTNPAIALEIVGFASSAEFRAQGTVLADSSRLNLEAANRRAREVG